MNIKTGIHVRQIILLEEVIELSLCTQSIENTILNFGTETEVRVFRTERTVNTGCSSALLSVGANAYECNAQRKKNLFHRFDFLLPHNPQIIGR